MKLENRTLPPFALFDAWGVEYEGTVGSCAESLRQRYAALAGRNEPPSTQAFGENLRAWRFLNRMSLRTVAKTVHFRRDRLKAVEAGHLEHMGIATLNAIIGLYGCTYLALEQQPLLRYLASSAPTPLHQMKLQESAVNAMLARLSLPGAPPCTSCDFVLVESRSIEQTLGENLRFARRRARQSLYRAAAIAGVTIAEIQALECGQGAGVAMRQLERLARAYGEPCPVKLMLPDYACGEYCGLLPQMLSAAGNTLDAAMKIAKMAHAKRF